MKYALILLISLFIGCAKSSDSDPAAVVGSAAAIDNTLQPTPTPTPTIAPNTFIVPCPESVVGIPNLLLKQNTNVFKVVDAGGGSPIYTFLAPGSYVTTDGRACGFKVKTDGSVE